MNNSGTVTISAQEYNNLIEKLRLTEVDLKETKRAFSDFKSKHCVVIKKSRIFF